MQDASPRPTDDPVVDSPDLGDAGDAVREVIAEIKPKLRGWLHLSTVVPALAAFIVLISLAPGAAAKVACAIYMVSALLLFSVSAIYHTGTWTPETREILKRFDHANIFVLIAGSYTPFTVILLDGSAEKQLLIAVWVGAVLGVFFRIFWVGAPRWLYVPIYIALGWAAVFFIPDFAHATSVAVLVLIIVGGVLYSLGAVFYGLKWPGRNARYFGFHEYFHLCTVAAFVCHYVGLSIAAYTS